jgi:tetraacyldisaccharide 4'-kinase
VYVSPDRAAAAQSLLRAHPEVDVIVSDDGLQHYGLARDVEIAVVDGERRFGNGLLLPSGPLREPVSRLKTVDAVVVNGERFETGAVRQFAMTLGNERFLALLGNAEMTPPEFALAARGRNVVAVAGIGNPARFFEHLARLGIIARRRAFPDHHHYQPSELRLPDAELIVMTEKDAVKCAAFADARMWSMRVDAILPADFEPFLLECVRLSRGRPE